MVVKIKKGTSKPSTLTCVRSDGSVTWTKLQPGIEIHDMAHYVVETQLDFQEAFYGIVAKGFNITDFELPKGQRPLELEPVNLSIQALQTEHIVNLLQMDLLDSSGNTDIIAVLKEILSEKGIDYPENLNAQTLAIIQKKLWDLYNNWLQMEEDQTLELLFTETTPEGFMNKSPNSN